MNIGVFGTGMVGETIATKLVALGHNGGACADRTWGVDEGPAPL